MDFPANTTGNLIPLRQIEPSDPDLVVLENLLRDGSVSPSALVRIATVIATGDGLDRTVRDLLTPQASILNQ
ncbi:MAG: hypothetical protein AAGA88_05445 [Pseudomonadota bacterium]